MLASVAGEAVELGEVGVGERLGLERFDALQVPAGGDELFEDGEFQGAGGRDLGAVVLLEFLEGCFFGGADAGRPVRL
ncbi:MAG: hypothetical protein K2X03_29500 [Bryobacteraceae bacterium]|nr:hypothetical protein [Bryobacteraceae bacterium]